MRVAEVQPQEKRLVRRLEVEELLHLLDGLGVGALLHVIKPLLERAQAVLLQEFTDHGAPSASRAVEMIGTPADADEIAGLLAKHLRKSDLLTRPTATRTA